jgi:hypothetical protein
MNREEGVPWVLKVMKAITARTTEEGSKTIVDAAARGKESNRKYFDHQKIAKYVSSMISFDLDRINQDLWTRRFSHL